MFERMSPRQTLPPEVAAFYAGQSAFSAPGRHARLYDELPGEVRALAEVARGLMIHRVEGEIFGYGIPEDRLHNDAETRYLDDILGIIMERGAGSLTRARAPEDRFVGICRDFALSFCSFLRHQGVPARLRSGFADYFGSDGFHFDHVVTEYWDDRHGWRLADPQLADERVIRAHAVDFGPMDVPRDRFLVAGRALQLVQSGQADPKTFGIPLPDGRLLAGEWFVVGDVRLDLAALNKTETLLWDVWGAGADGDEALTGDVRDLYERVANVTATEVDFAAVRRMFSENEDLRTPGEVLCLAPFNGPSRVTLR